MTQLLISVSSVDEAAIALDKGINIIDLKHPAKGALGALAPETIQAVAKLVRSRDPSRLITATIGDLPMQPDLLRMAVAKLATLDVDVIKIGFFDVDTEPDKIYAVCLEALHDFTCRGVKLVAVMFAELIYSAQLMQMLKNAGFYGVMMDTVHKNGASLLDLLTYQQLQKFLIASKANDLQAGLAGSLKLAHIPVLKQLMPDYIGLRGGVCDADLRINALSASKVEVARGLL